MNLFRSPLITRSLLWLACLAAPLARAALPVPPPPPIAAKAYIVTDFQTGTMLASVDPDKRIEPASLTKLMTAYLSFQAVKEGRLKLDQMLTVSEKAWKAEGSRMFIKPNSQVKVDDLIHGMIIQSGNDSSITLAEGIAGSEEVFANMMNQTAQKLGMKSTHFMNSTGLPDPQHYTTARDLSLLASAIIRDYPQFFPIYSMKEFSYNNIKQPNRNLLLWRDPNVDGMKTGHTESAGYCLVSTMKRDGRRVISVLVGASSDTVRATESLKLLNYGIQFFATPKLYSKGQVLQQVKVWKGEQEQVSVGMPQDLYINLPRGAEKRLKAQLVTQQPLTAPIASGQVVGKLMLSLDGQAMGTYPVAAMKAVPEAGVFGRMWDSMKLWFE
ncbi:MULTISPECIES: D-alanyl-D-alanine carboxypeptidase family protein [Leeia]|uniref:serine-type D-Ala-D-Ala carboxypeptidase n=1 Tax=Leeia aquatica TaxID=2725557 RepID=A0A847SCT8_9NEIS|nr:D-alanyl-D-alanine carboxypeptidase family protein [Leeia aquatica]NLR75286.1 D-alanyl-D-alanine carboxypeptidase [Leeia aquatica]